MSVVHRVVNKEVFLQDCVGTQSLEGMICVTDPWSRNIKEWRVRIVVAASSCSLNTTSASQPLVARPQIQSRNESSLSNRTYCLTPTMQLSIPIFLVLLGSAYALPGFTAPGCTQCWEGCYADGRDGAQCVTDHCLGLVRSLKQ